MFSPSSSRRGVAQLLVLLAYIVGSLLATWPLAAYFSTRVPGDGIDDPALLWNLWWIKFRLVDQLQPDIFHVDWLFHPININLGFYTLTPLNGLLSIPLQSAMTLPIASNLLLLSSFVLGGYGTLLLTQSVWARQFSQMDERLAWAIAWIAGAFFAFASVKLFYASLGQFNITSSQWLPFCALYLWRTLHSDTRRRAWRNGILAGLFLVFQAWAELTFASFLLIFFALAYLHFSLTRLLTTPRQLGRWIHGTQGLIVAAIVFALGISPILAALLPDMRIEGDFFASGGGFADLYSADLLGYLLPTRLHPVLGAWVAELPFANDKAQQIFLGYTLMSLIVVGIVAGLRDRERRGALTFWLLSLILFWLLTLGPFLRWAGQELPIPGPFALVSQLPFFNGNRYPSRYSVMVLLCAALLAARGMLWLTSMRRQTLSIRPAFAMLSTIVLLFASEHISIPLPLDDIRIPSIYQRLAEQPGDFAVLELPTGWRNGARVLGKSDVLIMMQQWYQTIHTKRRLGGNTSRNPAYKFQYFSETPVLAEMIALMNADRSHLAPLINAEYPTIAEHIRQSAPALFELLGVRYVTLHIEKSPSYLIQMVEEALPVTLVEEWQGPDWTGAPSTIRLYSVNPFTSSSALTLDLATSESNMYLAEGWTPLGDSQQGRYATRQQVDLLLPALPNGAHLSLTYARASRVTYRYQGQDLGQRNGNVHELDLPPQNDGAPTTRITLRFDDSPTPITALVPTASSIGQTGISLAPGIAILLQSAGEEVGSFAHIWINGVDYATGERGYQLVALTPTGEVLAQASFDTMTAGESTRFAQWLNRLEQGTIVVGAVSDSAATEDRAAWDEQMMVALQKIGVTGDLRGKLRWSHAFAGVVGAPPASALEDIQSIHPASLWIGAPLSAPAAYGPLQQVVIDIR